jgi:hypothetical protein
MVLNLTIRAAHQAAAFYHVDAEEFTDCGLWIADCGQTGKGESEAKFQSLLSAIRNPQLGCSIPPVFWYTGKGTTHKGRRCYESLNPS